MEVIKISSFKISRHSTIIPSFINHSKREVNPPKPLCRGRLGGLTSCFHLDIIPDSFTSFLAHPFIPESLLSFKAWSQSTQTPLQRGLGGLTFLKRKLASAKPPCFEVLNDEMTPEWLDDNGMSFYWWNDIIMMGWQWNEPVMMEWHKNDGMAMEWACYDGMTLEWVFALEWPNDPWMIQYGLNEGRMRKKKI